MSVDQRQRPTRRRKLSDPEDLPLGGSIDHACRLGDELVLALVSLAESPPQPFEAMLRLDESWHACKASATPFDVVSTNGTGRRHRALVLLQPPSEMAELGPVALRTKSGDVVLKEARSPSADVGPLLAELLTTPQDVRQSLLDFLIGATADATFSRRKLASALNRIRDTLRERLPVSVVERDEPRAVNVDGIWQLDERAFYLEGWARHEEGTLESLTAVSPEGERIEFGATVFRYPRPDVSEFYGLDGATYEKLGFIAYLETTAPSTLSEGWVVELHDATGAKIEVRGPQVTRDIAAARSTILGDFIQEPLPAEDLKTRHLRPAIERIQRRLASHIAIAEVDEYGSPPTDPEVSIVVPLYQRVDFVEHQLAQFVHDPELFETELIYVLDSPEQADYLRSYARQLHRLYRVPFRVVTLSRNGGFSLANNLGASVAGGRLLLLLNSDVLPERPGWVGELAAFYDSSPKIGALSPKLLYEDDSLQHAGLYFDRPEGTFVWANEHYFKGLHRDLAAANEARPVPAVTGACLMVSRSLFEEHGGLPGHYVQGDYEDSDLCLRLAAAGLDCWYLPSVTLYHLEGQSYPSEERRLASQYNKWLHTHLWGDAIQRCMNQSANESWAVG
jgi:GT2 family glycosyltransferase